MKGISNMSLFRWFLLLMVPLRREFRGWRSGGIVVLGTATAFQTPVSSHRLRTAGPPLPGTVAVGIPSRQRAATLTTSSLRMSFLSMPPSSSLLINGAYSKHPLASSRYETNGNDDRGLNNNNNIETMDHLLSPLTRELLEKLTENYVWGDKNTNNIDLLDILKVITEDFQFQPSAAQVQLGDVIFGKQENTSEEQEEDPYEDEGVLVAEVFSLAAQTRLSKELTLQLLKAVVASPSDVSTPIRRNTWALAIRTFRQYGWKGVSFHKGLSLRPRKGRRKKGGLFMRLFRSTKYRIQEAQQLVLECQMATPPARKLENREELKKELDAQFSSNKQFPQTLNQHSKPSRNNPFEFPHQLSYFPQQGSLSWKNIKRRMDRMGKTLKDKGRAGIVAYAFFNFVLYSVGALIQWKRIGPGDPAAHSVTTLVVRKLGRVLASMYVISNLLKIPKIMVSIALTPLTQQSLYLVRERLGVSENAATVLLTSFMLAAWIGILAIPIASEYRRLIQMVHLEGAVLSSAIHSV